MSETITYSLLLKINLRAGDFYRSMSSFMTGFDHYEPVYKLESDRANQELQMELKNILAHKERYDGSTCVKVIDKNNFEIFFSQKPSKYLFETLIKRAKIYANEYNTEGRGERPLSIIKYGLLKKIIIESELNVTNEYGEISL